MTAVVIIVSVKLLLLCMQWPELCSRVGSSVSSWIVAFVNLVARLVPQRREEPLPVARVVRR